MKRWSAFLTAAAVLAAVPVTARASGEMDINRAREDHHNGATHFAEPYVGHSETKKVHLQECEWAGKIAEANRVYFKTYGDAAEKGYRACKVCMPDRALPRKAAPEPRSPASPPAHASTPFVGHRVTRKVHRASCEWAEKIADENRTGFATCKEAQVAGYVACGKCKPDIKAREADEAPSPSPGDSGGPAPASGAARERAQSSAPAETHAAGELCASSNGKTFHKPDCAWAKKISGRNLVVYKTRDDALASGKTPCKACTP